MVDSEERVARSVGLPAAETVLPHLGAEHVELAVVIERAVAAEHADLAVHEPADLHAPKPA